MSIHTFADPRLWTLVSLVVNSSLSAVSRLVPEINTDSAADDKSHGGSSIQGDVDTLSHGWRTIVELKEGLGPLTVMERSILHAHKPA